MKGRFWRKALSLCLALLMVAALVPAQLVISAGAESSVSFIYRWWDSATNQVKSETRSAIAHSLQDYDDGMDDLYGGWYYSSGYKVFSDRVTVHGTVNIIICESGGSYVKFADGIHVPPGNTLNIYGQSGETQSLEAIADTNCVAAIGGNDKESCGTINIYSGKVTAKADVDAAGIGSGDDAPAAGNINIYGGTVDATGGSADSDGGAGIGGGGSGSGGATIIYGGNVTAKGGANAAGIGGGDGGAGGDIQIYGGTVNARGGSENYDGGAGIGGGNQADGGNITIYNGTVIAQGGCDGAGIGGGDEGSGGNITIEGGTVSAIGGKWAAGIGGGDAGTGGIINIRGGFVSSMGGEKGAAIGGGEEADAGTITLSGGTIELSFSTNGVVLGTSDSTKAAQGSGTINFNGATVKMQTGENHPCASARNVNINETENLRQRVSYKDKLEDELIRVPREAWLNVLTTFVKKFVVIEPCQHEDIVYTYDNSGHKVECPICGYSVIEPHTYGEPVWSWADDCTSATATFTCTDASCRYAETVNATVERTSVDAETNKATYTATVSFGGKTYTDTKDGYADHLGARLVGRSLSLDGDIGVNFYMELSEPVAKSDTAYMHFTIPKDGTPDTQNIKVSDARIVEQDDKTYYVFKCQVAAKEMTSEIKAQIIDGAKTGTEFTYSVKEYADYLLAHIGEREDLAKAAPLVKALLNYGANAQVYFDKTDKGLANAGLTDEEKALGEVVIDMAEPAIGALPAGTTFKGATLSLKSETTLSLYFKSSDTLSFSCNKYTVQKARSGSYQIARIRGIKAKKLGSTLTLRVNGATVSYSPLNYCKYALEDPATEENLKNVIKALYWYYKAADDYFDDAHTHTPGVTVRENVVPATETADGSYDMTVYCKECGEEISRVTYTLHHTRAVPEVPATDTESGVMAHYECSACGKLFTDEAGFFETTLEALTIPKRKLVDLGQLTGDYTAQNGDVLTGTLSGNKKITIAPGATVTLKDANITSLGLGAEYAGITPLGDATLLLEGESTVKGGLTGDTEVLDGAYPGVLAPKGYTLTIAGEGSLTASYNDIRSGYNMGSACGIGGGSDISSGNIVINSGTIKATGGAWAAGIGGGSSDNGTVSCGDITINGGTVTAKGGLAAGIGGGSSDKETVTCGDITINGGTVTADGKGAGIGSGYQSSCGDITINAGTVTATGGAGDAGIGCGLTGTCGDITINGGIVNATGGDNGAGIGGGYQSTCGTITITDTVTKVTATKGENAPYSIGAGKDGTCGTVTIGEVEDAITESPFVFPYIDLSKLTGDYEAQNGDVLTGTLSGNKKITIADGATVTLRDANITSLGEGADYAGITPLGNATILLKGESIVKGGLTKGTIGDAEYLDGAYPGVLAPEGYTLTIAGEGSLTASYNDIQSGYNTGSACGIGGGYDISSGNIVINSGTIIATGGAYAAGIGGGGSLEKGNVTCGDITINGGTVTAKSQGFGAGIGNGYQSSCGAITITGGTVTATGGPGDAGIGGGISGTCGDITITGGMVTATGDSYGAAIGGGDNATCGAITIAETVTKVTATKGKNAPYSIGAGDEGTCGTVTIGGVEGAITESPYTYEPN